MGLNSTEVAYGFGQFGSAFADTAASTVTAPEELAIVAIQFLADTSVSSLIAKDANIFPNTVSAAHDSGHYTRTVNGASSANKVLFDQENAGTGNNDDIEIGDELYITSSGVSLGTVTALDPDTDNTKEINRSTTTTMGDGITISFVKPGRINDQGVGGQALANNQVFPKGVVIYGRWDSISLNADAATAGVICYFGK